MQLANGLTTLIGGARSGKSDLAVNLGLAWDGPVTFIATGEAFDDDMAARIDRHKQDRPAEWPTIEAPRIGAPDVAAVPAESLLILDCVTLLVSNLLLAELPISDQVEALARTLADRPGPTIAVSNEVGMGVHPETALGRTYRDELGVANRILAKHSTETLLIVAGRALRLEPLTWSTGKGSGPAMNELQRMHSNE